MLLINLIQFFNPKKLMKHIKITTNDTEFSITVDTYEYMKELMREANMGVLGTDSFVYTSSGKDEDRDFKKVFEEFESFGKNNGEIYDWLGNIIEGKVENNFTYLSSYYLHHFIENSDQTRESLYELVQSAAFEGHKTGRPEDFYNALMSLAKDKGISTDLPSPSIDEIKAIFLKHVDTIFKRVEKQYPN